ncbi:vp39 [Sucra jujuba nucleopolyhedrovirus]|uniref:Vp39 n=1 Tax=Sucra jujuba nucleopolyhedrovirus TaxID=1563660 RepID=A0A097P905_9ABAC|nr:vp39 [Sucra jujuba nucleopolyhedrovirus]AIU41312.1 vp39 [Sucra jujuba nucleopolyhedrovirus]
MSLVPLMGSSLTNRLRSYCIFNSVQPLNACQSYGSPCTPDHTIDDGTYICQGHLTRLKMEKMVLPIPDSDGNTYNRLIARSLVMDSAIGDQRILVPVYRNYQTVLFINQLSYAEQLIWHMIYNNRAEQDRICNLLQVGEATFQTDSYKIAQDIFARTLGILALTNPQRQCSPIRTNNTRIYYSDGNSTIRDEISSTITEWPDFIKNLVDRLIAPEIINIDEKSLMLRNCSTCQIRRDGLIAEPNLYNPEVSRYMNPKNENILQIQTVLKFKGNSVALQRPLNRYEPFPVIVPLFLGQENVITLNTIPPYKTFVLQEQTPTLPAE